MPGKSREMVHRRIWGGYKVIQGAILSAILSYKNVAGNVWEDIQFFKNNVKGVERQKKVCLEESCPSKVEPLWVGNDYPPDGGLQVHLPNQAFLTGAAAQDSGQPSSSNRVPRTPDSGTLWGAPGLLLGPQTEFLWGGPEGPHPRGPSYEICSSGLFRKDYCPACVVLAFDWDCK